MAEEKRYSERFKDDPMFNDDSQPSVTSPEQVLRMAAENAGEKPGQATIPAPADAIDLAYRTALADVDAQEVGKAVASAQESGKPAEDIDVEAMGEGSPKTTARPKTAAKSTAKRTAAGK